MRLLIAAAGLAAAAAAEPMIFARGTTLEGFQVQTELSRVDHSSPEALARSFAEFDAAVANDCAAHFSRLGAQAHLEILARYYVPELVALQSTAYEGLQRAEKPVRCEVKSVLAAAAGTAVAVLERSAATTTSLQLEMRIRGESWWIERISEVGEAGKLTERDLGVPPLLVEPKVEPPVKPDLGTPESALASLHAEMRRLHALRARSQNQLFRHYFAIVSAFYGEEAATRAKAAQRTPEPPLPLRCEYGKAFPAPGGTQRIPVVVWETVALPGGESRRSAVARGSFDFRASAGGEWRVSQELTQKSAEGSPEPRTSAFALFLGVP